MNADSGNLFEDRLQVLQSEFPEAFVESKVDFDKLRASLGDIADSGPERYTFSWAGKRDSIQILQMPSRATLVQLPKESVDFEKTSNIFIEGENLEVLKLLYRSYFGQVKMIYIDPPYNTGNDFVYRDNYTDPLDTYLQLTGQRDSRGNLLVSNPETSGRFHSAWLTMMYPRLFVARQLLSDDGAIFVSIDDNEVYNLKMLMNEIFGEENFVALIVAQTNPRGRTLDRFIARTHEYIMVYARNANSSAIVQIPKGPKALAAYSGEDEHGRFRLLELRNRNPVFNRKNRPNLYYPIFVDPSTGQCSLSKDKKLTVKVLPLNVKGEEGCWTWGPERAQRSLKQLVARKVRTGAWRVFRKDYVPEQGATTKAKSVWLETNINHEYGKEELGRLFGKSPFDFPKSVELMKKCLQLGTVGDRDIVLDFFAGSATMAQAVLELNRADGGNRRFIMVQIQEPLPVPVKVSGGMTLRTLSQVGMERVRRVIKKLRKEKKGKLALVTPSDLGFRAFRLAESNYKAWEGVKERNPEEYASQMAWFTDSLAEGWTPVGVIWEVALKEGLSLNAHIEKIGRIKDNMVWRVTDPESQLFFLICLDEKLEPSTIEKFELLKDGLFICRDSALTDELAANLALQCRLKTI